MSSKKTWNYCNCGCGSIHCDTTHNPVAKVIPIGPWGDNVPYIRKDEYDGSLYIENSLCEYGNITADEYAENLYLIANAPKMFNLLKRIRENGLDEEIKKECDEILAENYIDYLPASK